MRIAVIALLSALLSGCFASERPMFAPGTAVRALGEGGKYATFEQIDGKEKPSDPIEVRPRDGNAYDFINEKGAATPVTFHALPNGEHVAQFKLEGGSGYGYVGYGYVLLRIEGAQAVVIPAECNKQDAAEMAALGVIRRNQYECRIDQVADPVAFFAGLKRGEPASRMVRE
jgi:hypothetical protein